MEANKPPILTSWSPIPEAYRERCRKRFVREELHKSGWMLAGTVILGSLAPMLFSEIDTIRPYAGLFYIFVLIVIAVLVMAHSIYVAFRSNVLCNKLNGPKAGLIDLAVSLMMISVGWLISMASAEFFFFTKILVSTILFGFAIVLSLLVELRNIADDAKSQK